MYQWQSFILYKYQLWFQEGKATYMALIFLIENKKHWRPYKGGSLIGVFLDFSKAFDIVNYGILLAKLNRYGVHDTEIKRFEDYRTNRMQ